MALASHLFASSSDGALYDTRPADWSKLPALRPTYDRTPREIGTGASGAQEVKAALRAGAFTGLGGYPLYFVTHDGAALSFEAVREQLRNVLDSVIHDYRDGWRVVAVEVNYEDADLTCEHTGERIASAHGDDSSEPESDGQPDEAQEWESFDPDC